MHEYEPTIMALMLPPQPTTAAHLDTLWSMALLRDGETDS
jgi:hypothetical protein